MTTDERAELESLRASVKHIQEWIHSGDRERDVELQADQWGQDVCLWITGYCDGLRRQVAGLLKSNESLKLFAAEAREAAAAVCSKSETHG